MTLETLDPFMVFDDACTQRGIRLDSELYGAMRSIRDNENMYCPSSLQRAIAGAGRVVRKQFNLSLASEPIPAVETNDPIGINTLRQLINATLDEPTEDMPLEPTVTLEKPYALALDACPEAEGLFGQTLDGIIISRQPETARNPYGYEVFVDDDDPLFLRKASGVTSSLSLRPVALNGIVYPAGAIFRIDAKDDITEFDGPIVAPKAALQRQVTDITQASFLRLSAFAYPPEQWTEFRVEEVEHSERELGVVIHAHDSARVEQARQKLIELLPELPDGLEHRS